MSNTQFPEFLMNLPISENYSEKSKDSYQKWLSKQSDNIKSLSKQSQTKIYKSMQKILKEFNKHRNFNININSQDNLRGFIEAIKIFGSRLGKFNVRLTFIDSQGNIDYRHLSKSTIQFFDYIFNNDDIERIKDSNDDIIDNLLDVQTIHVEFTEIKQGKRKIAGFFPYINKSSIDLTKFAIFKDINHPEINNSCLYHAFKYSNLLTENELNMLNSYIKTRYIPQTSLKEISELFKIHINCKTYFEHNDKTSHEDYGKNYKEKRSIKLIIYNNHYMLNDYVKSPKRIHIIKLIKSLISNNLLIPMTEKQVNLLDWSFKPKTVDFKGYSRLINVPDRKNNPYISVKQTKHFFGYKPDVNEIDERIWELQKIVNELPLRHPIDVSLYFKFSELMQKIMYEYGCYDDVYEFSGDLAKNIRKQCKFPKIHTFNDKSLYRKEKLYYIDLNGAYMAAVKSIPTGQNFDKSNTKIKELIETLYEYRIKAKKSGNDKLAITLKFLMNSCWGFSIQKPKIIKHKYAKNVNNYIDTFSPFVIKYKYNSDKVSGFVDTINPFVIHYSFPQFAKSVLDEFHNMMNKIKKIVNVLYENIDAILISESDYQKLVNLGYVGDKLGQFKIEHVFNEIAIKSQRKFIGTLENGDKYYHCVNKNINYNDFIKECVISCNSQ